MKKSFKKNRQGSVLLAVVCMTMVCLTLATISLSAVNYTTKASSRNVQRTQAKVTAEAALTEFIEEWKATNNGVYTGLESLAKGNSFDTGYQLTVKMDGDSNFDSNLGSCVLSVYKQSTSGFKIESRCTYSTQTQSASVLFQAKLVTPYMPSDTLSAKNGTSINSGVATPVTGNTYIEKDETGAFTNNSIGFATNGANFYGHVFSEYNVKLDNSGTIFADGVNTTNSDKYVHGVAQGNSEEYFDQAPTLTIDGYLHATNDGSKITTTVGKSTVDGKNRDDYASEAEYQAAELSNTDGYVYVFKKIVMSNNTFTIGSSGRPIDVYCHGAYYGVVPTTVNGTATDRDTIVQAFDGNLGEAWSKWDHTVTGNFYSYKGQSASFQDGDVYINFPNGGRLTVNGDMFVTGNIYIDSTSQLKVTGTLYCTGKIYLISGGNNVTVSDTAEIKSENGSYVIKSESGNNNIASKITVGDGVSNTIDTTKARNQMPEEGYDPATGNTTAERQGLKIYDGCSPNDMFKVSIDGTSTDQEATKHIAVKYASAMTRTLDGTYKKALGGTEGKVSESYGSGITKINASVMLTKEQASSGNYLVWIDDEDIIIALPLTAESSWGEIGAKFRVYHETSASENYFCYFMFYDPNNLQVPKTNESDPDVYYCYYLASGDTQRTVTTYDGITYNMVPPTDDMRKGTYVTFHKDNSLLIGDYSSVGNSNATDNFNSYTYANTKLKNRIFYLVPDYTTFKVGNNGTKIQGIVYGPNSDVKIEGSHSQIFGKVNCSTFYAPQDDKEGVIQECREDSDSILGYVEMKNSSTSEIRIQYYEY